MFPFFFEKKQYCQILTRKRTIVDSLNGHDTPLPSSILLPYGGQKHMFPKYCHIFHFWPKFCINSSSQSPHEVKQILKRDISKMFTHRLPLKQSGLKLAVKSRLLGH